MLINRISLIISGCSFSWKWIILSSFYNISGPFGCSFPGNGTMEKLQQFFSSGQKYGDLTLDLHCNRFGPTALFHVGSLCYNHFFCNYELQVFLFVSVSFKKIFFSIGLFCLYWSLIYIWTQPFSFLFPTIEA